MANRKVNLFLVGAMRAGTTSLVELLSRHPDIYVPPIKEPNFFTEDLPKELYSPPKNFSIDRYFEKDFPNKRLHIAHIKKKEQYEKLYSGATNEKYLLDASTAYLHAPGVAQRIYEYNPEAKIIVLLRDPWERMISHISMDYGLGRIGDPLEVILKNNLEKNKELGLKWYDYLNLSLYDKPLFFFESYFPDFSILDFNEIYEEKNNDSINTLLDKLYLDRINIHKIKRLNRSLLNGPLWIYHIFSIKYIRYLLSKILRFRLIRYSSFRLLEKAQSPVQINENIKLYYQEIFSRQKINFNNSQE